MKRLYRFVLLALAYPFAVARVLGRRVGLSGLTTLPAWRTQRMSTPGSKSKTKRALTFGALTASLVFGLVAIGLPSGAALVTDNSTGCSVDAGTSVNVTVTKVGTNCVVRIIGNTTLVIPTTVSSIQILAVGGGGGGGADGGSGGGGGELRTSSSQLVTAGQTVTINIGGGGQGGSWVSGRPAISNGGTTTVSGAGLSYSAFGGSFGGGWTTTTGGAGGTGGSGGSGTQGGRGGGGPGNCPTNTALYFGAAGSSGPSTSIGAASNTNYGGGGGGGLGADTANSGSAAYSTAVGGAGGGGRGADYKIKEGGTLINGASAGSNGSANTGGGGGGGSACNAHGPMNLGYDGYSQRTDGGTGGSGLVIMAWQAPSLSITQPASDAPSNSVFQTQPKVQLLSPAGASLSTTGVPVTASITSGTASLGGTPTVNTVNGVATFTDLKFSTGAAGATITVQYFSAGYYLTSETILIQFDPSTVTISSTASSNGSFHNGQWYANSSATSNISVTDLQAQLTLRPVVVRASGAITVSAPVSSSATNSLSLSSTTGACTNPGGAISLASDLSVSCATVTTSATLTTSGTGKVSLTSLTGAMSAGAAISSAADLRIESASTTAINANLNAGSQGILVKSVGRITGSAGTSALVPRLISTASGPITLWTTGATGGVQLGNFTQLNSTNSGLGADITIGGGVATTADPARPSGFAQSSAADGIALGTGATASGVVMVAGSGNISLSGDHTSTGAHSGVDIFPGVDIVGNQVSIRGTSGYNISGTDASGVSAYVSSTIKSLIHATGSFVSASTALQIVSSSASSTGALLGPQTAATDALTFRVTGNNAGISITGTTSRASSTGLWLASATF